MLQRDDVPNKISVHVSSKFFVNKILNPKQRISQPSSSLKTMWKPKVIRGEETESWDILGDVAQLISQRMKNKKCTECVFGRILRLRREKQTTHLDTKISILLVWEAYGKLRRSMAVLAAAFGWKRLRTLRYATTSSFSSLPPSKL